MSFFLDAKAAMLLFFNAGPQECRSRTCWAMRNAFPFSLFPFPFSLFPFPHSPFPISHFPFPIPHFPSHSRRVPSSGELRATVLYANAYIHMIGNIPQRGWAPLRGAEDQYLCFSIEKLGSIQQEKQLQVTYIRVCGSIGS